MLDATPATAAAPLLRELDAALTAGDAAAAAALRRPAGFWRDLVSITWNGNPQEHACRRPRLS